MLSIERDRTGVNITVCYRCVTTWAIACGCGRGLPLIIPEGAVHFRLCLVIWSSEAELGSKDPQVLLEVVEAGH